MMPEYPDTKDVPAYVGIVHFIHCPKPIPDTIYELDEQAIVTEVSKAFTRVMSPV